MSCLSRTKRSTNYKSCAWCYWMEMSKRWNFYFYFFFYYYFLNVKQACFYFKNFPNLLLTAIQHFASSISRCLPRKHDEHHLQNRARQMFKIIFHLKTNERFCSLIIKIWRAFFSLLSLQTLKWKLIFLRRAGGKCSLKWVEFFYCMFKGLN